MLTIAQLLSDEPKKLESIILSILKILATVWIANLFFGINTDLTSITMNSFFSNFQIDQSIYFILITIGLWLFLWEFVINYIVEILINWVSRIGNPANTLQWYLEITKSVKTKKETIIDTKPNILHFTEAIQNENEDYPFVIETRANQIFSVGLICFIILLSSKIKLDVWQIILGTFFLLNFFVVSTVQRKLYNYYIDNSESIRASYYPLGQRQKVKEVITQIDDLGMKYSMYNKGKRIILNRIEKVEYLPEEILIFPIYINNVELGERMMIESKGVMFNNLKKDKLHIFCTNVSKQEKQLQKIDESLYMIKGESREELYRGFEELFYQLKEDFHMKKNKDV